MDERALRASMDSFAAFLSEVTVGDLGAPVEGHADIACLLVAAVNDLHAGTMRLTTGQAGTGTQDLDRESLVTRAEYDGTGYDRVYRQAARNFLEALDATVSSADAQHLISALVASTDARSASLARALGLEGE